MRFIGISALALALGTACKSADRPAATPAAAAAGTSLEATTFAPSLEIDLKAMTKTPTGLYYRDLVVGTGPTAEPGKKCSLNYRGQLADGSQFDATGPGAEPFTFIPGQGRVIPGWEQGVPGMKVGGKRQLVIPAALGYGESGSGPIPPNAVLVFMLELVGVE